jgi:siroheme synthase-like protein
MSVFPVMLDGSHFSALVVGGGPVALRKTRALLDGGVRVRVIAVEVSAEFRDLASTDTRLDISIGEYSIGALSDATIVVAATNDAAVNARIADDARAAGRLVNVADDAPAGNFVTPAVHRSGDLTIAVSAGRLPGAAVAIRDAIGERFDERYAAAIDELRELRSRLVASGETDVWKAIAVQVLDGTFCTKVEAEGLGSGVRRWQ